MYIMCISLFRAFSVGKSAHYTQVNTAIPGGGWVIKKIIIIINYIRWKILTENHTQLRGSLSQFLISHLANQ